MHFPLTDKLCTRRHCLKIKCYLNPVKFRNAIVYHRGGVDKVRDNTDVELDFRQESNFFYLTGVEKPGFHVIFDLASELVHLVPPTIPDDQKLWTGVPDSPETLLEKYDADTILEEHSVAAFLQARQPSKVLVLDITDVSALLQAGVPPEKIDYTALQSAIEEARLVKFPWEIDLIRYAAHVSSHAHIELMQHVAAAQFEWELEARFRWVCAKNGAKWQSYIPIIASGPRAATLHYTRNDACIPADRHALVLADAGSECRCYGSDVTRTFPVSGFFTEEAKTIYEIVLKAQEAVLSRLKAGVMWMDMHLLVVQILCTELVRIGILRGDPEELIRLGLYRAFYFHGTGHSVGLDVHDVGGRQAGILESKRRKEFVPQEALLGRPLEENMVVTVEPGLYFNETSLKMWTTMPGFADYFDMKTIKRYWPVGGVRIEDTVVITKDGIENLTIAPKRVQDIEAIIARRNR